MEKVINLDKIKETLISQIEDISNDLTDREKKKLNKLIESKDFYMNVVKECANVMIELFNAASEFEEEIEAEYNEEEINDKSEEKPTENRDYYNNMQVLGNTFEVLKDDYAAVSVRDRILDCISIELNKKYMD